jgi:hypothetical protein
MASMALINGVSKHKAEHSRDEADGFRLLLANDDASKHWPAEP